MADDPGLDPNNPGGQDSQDDKKQQLDPEAMAKALEAARKEAAAHRVKLKEFETAEEARKQAALSDEEKRQAAHDKAQKDAEAALGELKATRLQLAVERSARKLSIVDEDAAFRLLDTTKVEFDAAGQPTNVETLLTDLAKAKPYLVATEQRGTPQGSPANPARPRVNAGGTFTQSQIADRSFYEANREAIFKAMAEGRIVPG